MSAQFGTGLVFRAFGDGAIMVMEGKGSRAASKSQLTRSIFMTTGNRV